MNISAQTGMIRIGLLAKGVVYFLMGAVALLSIIGTGGQISGKKGIVHWIMNQSYGPYIVAFLAIGSLIYSIWSLVSAYKSKEHKKPVIGILLRLGEGLSGLLYLLFAIYAGSLVLKHFYPDLGVLSDGDERTGIFAELMQSQPGRIFILFLALIIGVRGIYSAYIALLGKHKKKVKSSGFNPKYKKHILRAGYIGYLGQAVSALIVTYLLYKAVENHDPSHSGKEEDVFRFVEGLAGTSAVAIIAFGLFCYGFFMMVQARYGRIKKVI